MMFHNGNFHPKRDKQDRNLKTNCDDDKDE